MVNILAQGAEAVISLEKDIVLKNRIAKGYRLPELDEKIRKKRTEKEAKILEKAGKIICVPKVLKVGKFEIELEFIDGDKLSLCLNSYDEKKQFEVMKIFGEETAKLHNVDIIHGDLTTSNTILKDEKLYIIDFGLSFISHRIEDKAVDLHLIKQALEAKHFSDGKIHSLDNSRKHFQNHEKLFDNFKKGYEKECKDAKAVLEQLKKVETRGRYKH